MKYIGQGNFYRLKSPARARAEGHVGRVNGFLIFGIAYTAVMLGFVVYSLIIGTRYDLEAYLCVAFFAVGCAAFLGYGIYGQIQYNRRNAAERKLLADCLCTDGVIDRCTCRERETTHSGRSSSYRYDVTVHYSFYDEENNLKCRTFSDTYDYDPEFYEGQWLMIAFNSEHSAILGRFEFVKEDRLRFERAEAERSADDFNGLDNNPVKLPHGTKIRSAELEYTWLWAALGIFVMLAGYTVPISILVTPQLVTGRVIPDVIFIALIYLLPTVWLALIAFMLTRFFKKRLKFKRILNGEHYFVRGKMFASEKTYRNGGSKQVFYCYVDREGKRHTEPFKAPAARKMVQGRALDVIIMCCSGESVPLYDIRIDL